jgi:hypothetical protein
MVDEGTAAAVLVVLAIIVIATISWLATVRARAREKSSFTPRKAHICSRNLLSPGAAADSLYVDEGVHEESGTVEIPTHSTLSRVVPDRGAESAEAAEQPNDVTGVGKTSRVRAGGDRFRRDALDCIAERERDEQHGAGAEGPFIDSPMSLLTQIARRPMAPAYRTTSYASLTDYEFRPESLSDGGPI